MALVTAYVCCPGERFTTPHFVTAVNSQTRDLQQAKGLATHSPHRALHYGFRVSARKYTL